MANIKSSSSSPPPSETRGRDCKNTLNVELVETGICPLCRDGANKKPLFKLTQMSVYRCSACGLKFIDPSLSAEAMISIYTSSESLRQINPVHGQYYEYEFLNPKSRTCRDYKTALERVSTCVEGRDLLEVGCGSGGFLEFARGQGWNGWGVDSSADNISKLQERGISGTACDYLDFSSEKKFDVVALWDLIEHPQDPLGFVKKSYELLKPGGVLLLATPCDPNLLAILAAAIYRISGGKIKTPLEKLYFLEHTSYFNLKTLSSLLGWGRFRIVQSWKTETDLARYQFSKPLRFALTVSFLIARFFNLQNRLLVIARPVS